MAALAVFSYLLYLLCNATTVLYTIRFICIVVLMITLDVCLGFVKKLRCVKVKFRIFSTDFDGDGVLVV